LIVGIAAVATLVAGFGTINLAGQFAEHEKITRLALKPFGLGPKTLSEVAGKSGSMGAVGAPDWRLLTKPAAHCDGGDWIDTPDYPQSKAEAQQNLEACRAHIFAALEEAVTDAAGLLKDDGSIDPAEVPSVFSCKYTGTKGRAKCNVLEDLGLAMHAAQDFYSHSNWVDKPAAGALGPENPPGLGRSGRAPWLDPRLREAVPKGLISGCYESPPEELRCNYGDGKPRVKHKVLNKDTGDIDVKTGRIGRGKTIRGKINDNFARAIAAAIADTRDKWQYFEERVLAVYGDRRGKAIICAMRADNLDSC